MKYALIIAVVVITALVAAQLYFTFSLSNVETHHYTVITKKGNIELRKYDPALFISYTTQGEMFEAQNTSFRNLAGYIFGDNQREQKIAMTAPVQMEQNGSAAVMRFMIPNEYDRNDLPYPNNPEVRFTEESGFYAAVMSYGGFSNEKIFQQQQQLLSDFITNENLSPQGEYIFLGYNPPFQWFGRKNEVMVKIERMKVTAQ